MVGDFFRLWLVWLFFFVCSGFDCFRWLGCLVGWAVDWWFWLFGGLVGLTAILDWLRDFVGFSATLVWFLLVRWFSFVFDWVIRVCL